MKKSEDFGYFLNFIVKRQQVFVNRFNEKPFPWTEDPILRDFKFTNVYRFLDFESQYLIKNVIKTEEEFSDLNTIFRVLLFKTFNLSTTWEFLESKLGRIDRKNATKDKIIEALNELVASGGKVFSSAYLQASSFVVLDQYKHLQGRPKHEQYLTVWGEEMLYNDKVLIELLESKDLESLCNRLQLVSGIGRFMSYQFAQDLNYTSLINHDMSKHTEEGPGSIRGIRRMFDLEGVKKPDYKEILKWTHANINSLFEEYGLDWESVELPDRPLGLEDIQNCFCETDKYMREVYKHEGSRIKQRYKPNGSRKVTIEIPL